MVYMEKIKSPIIFASSFWLFYQLSPYIGFSDNFIITMYILSPLVVLWMAYRILKDGAPSGRSFDEYFYDDIDYKRNKSDKESS